jgi:phosphotransferase family enzyme
MDVDAGEAERWVRSHATITGPLTLFQKEPWASVFRAPIAGGTVWFKACAPRQAFEVPLTVGLSGRWLLMADAGQQLGELGNPPERWLQILPPYAALQVGETDRAHGHVALGVPDRRVSRLPALYDDFLEAELPIDRDERSALEAIRPRFEELCTELDAIGIAPTIQHDDLHMTNVYVRNGELRILDWGDASISHPFFSLFEPFRFLSERNGLDPDDPWFGRLRDAYLEPWGHGRGAFGLALRVSGLAHAIAWLWQREALRPEDRADFDVWFAVIIRLALRGW